LAAVYRSARIAPSDTPVVVLDDPRPDAFTTPAPAARIMVTTGLLSALTQDEQRVVLAHERSHLKHRHIWWTLTADLAAAVNPLLRPTARVVAQAVERWADEDAAAEVGDRRLVARTIARAALLQHDAARRPSTTPAVTGGDVPRRVRAMLDQPPRSRPIAALTLAALLATATLGAGAVERTGERLFERAVPTAGHSQHTTTPHGTRPPS
jgi:beta-lactamase regulating signal transducer with metallopeptidase domain